MTEAEDKEKAEKLAAAKKKYEQLKKQKNKKAGAAKRKGEEAKPDAEPSTVSAEHEVTKEDVDNAEKIEAKVEEELADQAQESASEVKDVEDASSKSTAEEQPSHGRQHSLSLQSRMRSDSFRRTSISPQAESTALKSPPLPMSPGGESMQDLYRKQASRIDELERENTRLEKVAQDAEARWQKLEEELESAREGNSEVAALRERANEADSRSEEIERLKTEIASLQRQNIQLQSAASKPRRVSSSATPPSGSDDLAAQLESKSSTIQDMELTISNLRAQLASSSTSSEAYTARISAFEASLARAEAIAESATAELNDLRVNTSRASERNATESSARISAETRASQLESSLAAAHKAAEEAAQRTKSMEQKIEALSTLHRESDARSQGRLREFDRIEKEARDLRTKLTIMSNENARLREASDRRRKAETQGADHDDAMDELEDEERMRLRGKIRELEADVFDLRRGVWRDKRVEMQGDMPADRGLKPGTTSPGFDDIDLTGASPPPRQQQHKGSSFQDVISSGLSALTGGGGGSKQQQARRGQSGAGLLEGDEFEDGFDEEAFQKAQEEEGKRRIEMVREIKRGLKEWVGWRMDLVDSRAGVAGWGPIFEI